MKLRSDQAFKQAYLQADYRICDSQLIQFASYFLGTPIRAKISGSNFFPTFYQYHAHTPKIKIFLLGAKPGVAALAQQKINAKVGRNIIVDNYSPPFGFETDEIECQNIIDLINQSGATVLAVGLGSPKQEKWLASYQDKLTAVKICMAIGSTIDFEAGHIRRSPQWLSEIGLEWLFRLCLEPKRLWRRYLLEDIPFFGLVLQQKLRQGGLWKQWG
jgi:exopolysaccharide biosynthesis WecB/TagA/CpsF family protein